MFSFFNLCFLFYLCLTLLGHRTPHSLKGYRNASQLLHCVIIVRPIMQPRSQALSSLPPLVVGRNTLVAAGHVTTQNLSNLKKKLLDGRGGRVF